MSKNNCRELVGKINNFECKKIINEIEMDNVLYDISKIRNKYARMFKYELRQEIDKKIRNYYNIELCFKTLNILLNNQYYSEQLVIPRGDLIIFYRSQFADPIFLEDEFTELTNCKVHVLPIDPSKPHIISFPVKAK